MQTLKAVIAVAFYAIATPVIAQEREPTVMLAQACGGLPVADACGLIAEAATMLRPSYAAQKETDGEAAFRALGYEAEYIPARTTLHRPVTDVFLVSRPGSNRLFVVITGTESLLDWVSNARFTPYTGTYRDGEFYAPPGHGGFRGGLIDMIAAGILRENEFDAQPLNCPARPGARSLLSEFLCRPGIRSGPAPMELVIVGHSRGAGIGVMAAAALTGYEVKRPSPTGPASVGQQQHWPLRLHAIIGFAPPYAISKAADAELGLPVPAGISDHETILRQLGVPDRTIMFINDRDIVPSLSFGQARHRGHLFRIRRDGAVVREGSNWGREGGLLEAHGSAGYCTDVLSALGRPLQCEPRSVEEE